MKPADVLSLILIAVVVVDIVLMRVEMRNLREYKRKTAPTELVVTMTCDNTEFIAKMDEATAAAKRMADQCAETAAQRALAS